MPIRRRLRWFIFGLALTVFTAWKWADVLDQGLRWAQRQWQTYQVVACSPCEKAPPDGGEGGGGAGAAVRGPLYRVVVPPLFRARGVPVYDGLPPASVVGWVGLEAAVVRGTGRRRVYNDPRAGMTWWVEIYAGSRRAWLCERFLEREE